MYANFDRWWKKKRENNIFHSLWHLKFFAKCQLIIKWNQRTKSLNINTLLKGITIEWDNTVADE